MSSSNEKIFVTLEDNNSSVNSTPASSPRSYYPVETILIERTGSNGRKEYLVKWDDYPLHRSTWEPEENLNTAILKGWEGKKTRIEQGLEQAFDLNGFNRMLAERSRRHKNPHVIRDLSTSPERMEIDDFASRPQNSTFPKPESRARPPGYEEQRVPKRAKVLKKGTARLKKTSSQLRRKSSSGRSPISISSDEAEISLPTPRNRRPVVLSDSDDEPQVHSQDSLFQEPQDANQQLCHESGVDQSPPGSKQMRSIETAPDSLQTPVELTKINALDPENMSDSRKVTIHIPKKSTSFGLLSGTSSHRPSSNSKVSSKSSLDSSARTAIRAHSNTSKLYSSTFGSLFSKIMSSLSSS